MRRSVIASLLVVLTGCSSHLAGASPRDSTSTDLRVPTAAALLGHWRLVSVRGQRPPANAERSLTLTRADHRYSATWSDGVNDHSLRWRLTTGGDFLRDRATVTLVGCVGHCTRPSGFGIASAHAVRLTSTGQLVFLDSDAHESARYKRVS
ncbi:MAG: hypothetical protein QM747_06100 [Nocardioides sp.]